MITSIHPNPVTTGTVERGLDIPVNKWWGIRYGEGDEGAWQGGADRGMDRLLRSGMERALSGLGPWGASVVDEYFGNDREMALDDANKAYGIEGVLKFDAPIRESDARTRRERALAVLERQQWVDSKKHSAVSWRGISGFGAMVAGQMSNPLDFGLSIMPIFGAEKIGVQAAAKVGWRNSLKFGADLPLTSVGQRGGLFSFKATGLAAKVPLFTESVLNGAASSAVGEIATFFDQRSLQEETNYFANVAVGAVSSGAFHAGIRLIGKVIEPSARVLRALTPETRETAAHIAPQMERITPEDGPLQRAAAGADENVIRSSTEQARPVPEDAMNAVREAQQSGVVAPIEKLAAENGIDVAGKTVEQVIDELLPKLGGAIEVIEIKSDASLGEIIQSGGKDYRVTATQEVEKNGVKERTVTAREIDTPERQEAQAKKREASIKSFLDSQDPKVVEAKAKAETQRSLAEAEKRTAPTAKGKEWAKVDDLAKEKAQLDAEANEIESQLKRELAEELGDAPAMKKIDKELAELKKTMDSETKAKKAAYDCLLKGGNTNA